MARRCWARVALRRLVFRRASLVAGRSAQGGCSLSMTSEHAVALDEAAAQAEPGHTSPGGVCSAGGCHDVPQAAVVSVCLSVGRRPLPLIPRTSYRSENGQANGDLGARNLHQCSYVGQEGTIRDWNMFEIHHPGSRGSPPHCLCLAPLVPAYPPPPNPLQRSTF